MFAEDGRSLAQVIKAYLRVVAEARSVDGDYEIKQYERVWEVCDA